MDVHERSLAVGREVIHESIRRGCRVPTSEEVGRMVRPDATDEVARNISRVVAAHIGQETQHADTLYGQALALGVPKEVFVGWLRDRTEFILSR